MNSFEGLWWTL